MSDSIITVENLTKDYGKGRGVFDLNLTIQPGEIYGYVGTNGSGKTTTIRNIMGFIRPDQGQATVLGKNSWEHAPELKNHISYIPGEIEFPRFPTGLEFLKYQAGFLGLKDLRRMETLIERLGLDPTANLKRMSKGMKQKTAIVAALMGNREILILDEPTTGLDPLMRNVFLDMIREEKAAGRTVFMSSHIFEEIEEICDRVSMIADGSIAETKTVSQIVDEGPRTLQICFVHPEDCQAFCDAWNAVNKTTATTIAPGRCELQLPRERTKELFTALRHFPVLEMRETRQTLEKHFQSLFSQEAKEVNRHEDN